MLHFALELPEFEERQRAKFVVLHIVIAVSWSPDGKHVSYLTKERAVCVCNSKFELEYTFNLPAEIGDVTENLQGKYKLKT